MSAQTCGICLYPVQNSVVPCNTKAIKFNPENHEFDCVFSPCQKILHVFCEKCLRQWALTKPHKFTCPLCRIKCENFCSIEKLTFVFQKSLEQIDIKEILEIINNFIEEDDFKTAKKIISATSNIYYLKQIYDYLYKTILSYKNKDNLDKALEVAKLISDQNIYNQAFLTISKAYFYRRDFDKALEVAKLLDNPTFKNQAFLSIVQAYFYRGNLDKALEVAKLISDQNIYNQVFHIIAQAYINRDDLDKALEVTKLISDQNIFNKIYHAIAQAHFNRDDLDKALEVAKLANDRTIYNQIYLAIVSI